LLLGSRFGGSGYTFLRIYLAMDQLDNLHYNNDLRNHMVIRPLKESGGLHIGS